MLSIELCKKLKEFGYPQYGIEKDGIGYADDGKKVWYKEVEDMFLDENDTVVEHGKVLKIPEMEDVLQTIVDEINKCESKDRDKFGTGKQGRLELSFDPYDGEWGALLMLDEFYIVVEDKTNCEEAVAELFCDFSAEIMLREKVEETK